MPHTHLPTPLSIGDLKTRIAERRIAFSTRPEQAMRLLLNKPEVAAFGSLGSVADACGVSRTTVMRLASLSGYSSFKEMKIAFQQHLVHVAGQHEPSAQQKRSR